MALLSVNAADLDFLLGLMIGDINRFHRSVTHSLLAAATFGIGVAIVARLWHAPTLRAGLLGAGLYTSHLLLDIFSGDGTRPSGQPLFWPFVKGEVLSHWTPLIGVDHGGRGDTLWQFAKALLSPDNLRVILLEALLFVPLFWLARRLGANGLRRYQRFKVAAARRSESEGTAET